MRQILLVAIAIISIFPLSGCADVDKGLYSVSGAVSGIDRVTGERSLNITPRPQQIQRGNMMADTFINEHFTSKNLPVNENLDPAATARIVSIFRRVIAVSHLSNETWKVFLVPDKEFNAFTTGGTEIVVFQGLLDKAQNDDEIAAVLGHEIAHVAANHVFEQQANMLAESVKSRKVASRASFQAAFTLANEKEADKVGTLYATLAGYDPYAASNLWKRMYEDQGDFSAMVINHPMNSERYEATKALADEYKQYYMPGQINPDHAAILRKVFMTAPQNTLQPGQGGGVAAVLDATLDGLNKYYGAKLEEKQQSLQMQRDKITQKSLRSYSERIIDSHTIAIATQYTGVNPLKSLSVIGSLNGEQAAFNINSPINPGDKFEIQLQFKNTDFNSFKAPGLKMIVAHAEWE